MVNYQCPRCGYKINNKSKYLDHLKRKFICKPKIKDINLLEEYVKYEILGKENFVAECKPNVASVAKCSILRCDICSKTFNHRSSLHRHIKNRHSNIHDSENTENMKMLIKLLNNQIEEQKEQQKLLKNQLEKRDKQIEELINKVGININNSSITQNIQLLAYNNSDMSHLTDKDFISCLNHNNMCIPYLIKKIHFNPKKPENHNIYISNIKNNYVMIYDGNKWTLKDREDIINNLIDDNEVVFEQKLEEWLENVNNYPEIMNKFNRYLEKRENDVVINKIKNEIKLILFNNRKLIKS